MNRHADVDARRSPLLPTPGALLASSGQWNRVIVLANRAPFRWERSSDGRDTITRSASGLVTAIEPLIEACDGTWIAHGTRGEADIERDCLNTSSSDVPRYRVRHVALPPALYDGYYCGFANEGLWPLCHAVPVAPVFRAEDFRMYSAANRQFAAAVAEEAAGDSALVLVQDYHFALAPRLLRHRLSSDSTIVAFWHIPWPDPAVLRTCPWATHLLEGLLSADVIGFQTPGDRDHFLEAVTSLPDAEIEYSDDLVTYRDHSARVRVHPVGVDWDNHIVRSLPSVEQCREQVRRDYQLPDNVRLGVGIDRLDYTKGIHEKFLAIERLLERHPELRSEFAFIQVAEPSRENVREYQTTRAQIEETARRVNARFGNGGHGPIRLLDAHHSPDQVYRFYRAADFCHVGSLHDGMNLVAKEFVCARTDHRGVLVLSEFAGAARQLRAAMLIDPYDICATAHALARALGMPPSEQAHRMRLLRAHVAKFDSQWWARQLIADAVAASQAASIPYRRLIAVTDGAAMN